jgi:hypothetical protein
VTRLRDRFTDARRIATRDLIARYLPETAAADPLGWNTGVRFLRERAWQEVERSMMAQYTFGRGGRNAMTAADRATLQGLLRTQKDYWDRFMGEALDGTMSRDGVANRATLYDDASTSFYERGRAEAFNIELPAHPGDGQTRCLARCRCSWNIVRRKSRTDATWKSSAEPCPDCQANAAKWAPLQFPHDGVDNAV